MKQSSYQDLQTCVWPESDRRSPCFRRENSDSVEFHRPRQRRGWPENVEEAFRSCGTRVPMTDSRTEFDRRVSSTGSGCPFEQPCLLHESFFASPTKEWTRSHFSSLHFTRVDLRSIWNSLRFPFASMHRSTLHSLLASNGNVRSAAVAVRPEVSTTARRACRQSLKVSR